MRDEYVSGYKIVRAVCFDDGCGFAFGVDQQAAFPYTIWQFDEFGGKRLYYSGHFFINENADSAELDYTDRIKEYQAANPGITERYNYLAAAEIGDEGNYNMIDGVINNVKKPSVLEQMREYERRIARKDSVAADDRDTIKASRPTRSDRQTR